MLVPRSASSVAAVVLSILVSACATGRTVITLPQPKVVPASDLGASQRTVFVNAVTDSRIFEDAPSEPSTPSLGIAPASASSEEIKARAIARKRHGYGLAQGDVILAEPLTVRQVVKASLESAFTEAGFRVVAQGGSATPAQVHVKQFWLWLQPGVMVGTIRSRVSATTRTA